MTESELANLRSYFYVPEHLRAQVRPEDVLIASYPRSGNSWVRWLLAVYFMKLAGLEFPHDFGPGKLIPDIHQGSTVSRYEAITQLGHRLIKSHQLAQFPENRSIYLVRKPEDCLVSYYRFLCDQEWARLLGRHPTSYGHRPSRLQLLRILTGYWRDGPDVFALTTLGNWVRQQRLVLEIREERPEQICLLTYEYLHRQGPEAVATMLRFLGAPVVEEIVLETLDYSKIDNLRKISMKSMKNARTFYRKGKVGDSRSILRPETLAKIEADAGELYRRVERPVQT